MVDGPRPGFIPEPPNAQGAEDGGAGFSDLRRSLSEALRVISIRRWTFFVPFCLVSAAAFVLSIYVPRRYEAVTMFERRDDPVLMNLPLGNVSEPFEIFRRTLVQDITNPQELIHVVDALGRAEFDRDGNPIPEEDVKARESRRQALAGKIAGGLAVSLRQRSAHLDVIEIRYTSDDPKYLAATLGGVRDHYIEMTQKRITSHLRDTRDYFDAERQERQDAVHLMEDDLLAFRAEHEGIDPLDPTATFPQLANARSRLITLERQHRELTIRLEGHRGLISDARRPHEGIASANTGGEIVLSARGAELSADYRRVMGEIDTLKTGRGMTDLHPDVVALRERLGEVGSAMDRERDATAIIVNGVGGTEANIIAPRVEGPWGVALSQATRDVRVSQSLLAENEVELTMARSEIQELEARRESAIEKRREYASLLTETSRAQEDMLLYQRYSDQVSRLLTAEDSERGILFEKIRPAIAGHRPVSPRVPTVLLLTLLAGLVSGVIMVMLGELLDRTVRTRRQINRAIGIPILESIDEIMSTAMRRKRMLIRALVVPSVSLVLMAVLLASGSAAYLSLENRTLYERAIAVPRSAIERIMTGWQADQPVAVNDAPEKERTG